jgi:hypothetical protein
MSGNADCEWILSRKCVEASSELAKQLECPIDDSSAMVDCLRSKSANSIAGDIRNGINHYDVDNMGVSFGPFIDGDFLPKPIAELRKEAPRKKWMFGTTEFEGLFFSEVFSVMFMSRPRRRCGLVAKSADYGTGFEP